MPIRCPNLANMSHNILDIPRLFYLPRSTDESTSTWCSFDRVSCKTTHIAHSDWRVISCPHNECLNGAVMKTFYRLLIVSVFVNHIRGADQDVQSGPSVGKQTDSSHCTLTHFFLASVSVICSCCMQINKCWNGSSPNLFSIAHTGVSL